MSWWSDIRDKWEQMATGGLYDPAHSRHMESNAKYAMQDQIDAFNKQTALEKEELDKVRNEQAVEKKRINDKQIRALRSRYRTAGGGSGALGSGEPATSDMSSQLGG